MILSEAPSLRPLTPTFKILVVDLLSSQFSSCRDSSEYDRRKRQLNINISADVVLGRRNLWDIFSEEGHLMAAPDQPPWAYKRSVQLRFSPSIQVLPVQVLNVERWTTPALAVAVYTTLEPNLQKQATLFFFCDSTQRITQATGMNHPRRS